VRGGRLLEAGVADLSRECAQFVATLPDHWRVDELRRKRVLREAARSILPREIRKRRKVGFREVGVYYRHGKLDGQWRDTVIVERLLGDAAT